MPDRLSAYAASMLAEWYGARAGTAYAITSAVDGGALPVFVAEAAGRRLALAIAPLWDADAAPGAEQARVLMQERLDAGSVRGPYLLWAPPRGAVPESEPEASDFVQRVQRTAASMQDGARTEVEFPVPIQLGKLRDEGGYASVIGGLSRWWTLITERVDGTFQVNSARIRRAPESAETRERLFAQIGDVSRGLSTGDAVELEASEAWTLQRLTSVPLGETGFAIAQAPPDIDPAEGTVMRRLLRKRLRSASEALASVEADVKGLGLLAIYDYAENETVGAFLKSMDPGLYAAMPLVAAIVDGEVRPIFQPR